MKSAAVEAGMSLATVESVEQAEEASDGNNRGTEHLAQRLFEYLIVQSGRTERV